MAVPKELMQWDQWVVWRYEKQGDRITKVPYNPHGLTKASTINKNDWASYIVAIKACKTYKFDGIGFVLTKQDPFCFIDLDYTTDADVVKKQTNIYNSVNSYAEYSPSGKGLHILCKAKIERGKRDGKIEIYDDARFLTVTGRTYREVPIRQAQSPVMDLWQNLKKSNSKQHSNSWLNYLNNHNQDETNSDDEVIEFAKNAKNGEKFWDIFNGDWARWADNDVSNSAADQALVNILAHYTQNREQIKRIWFQSKLNREKIRKRPNYVESTISKAFDQIIPLLDNMDRIRANLTKEYQVKHIKVLKEDNKTIKRTVEIDPPKDDDKKLKEIPEGLLRDLTKFFCEASHYPMIDIAMASALTLLCGVGGRGFNISGTGLNQYVLVLALSGVGKDQMKKGIAKLLAPVSKIVPTVNEFIGPSDWSSGSAIYRHLWETSPCFLSLIPEFGLKLKEWTGGNISQHGRSCVRAILELYGQSGIHCTLDGMAYSDSKKNIGSIKAPSVTLVGETTPGTFFNHLDEESFAGGFISRFLIIEYTGKRVYENNEATDAWPSNQLIQDFTMFATSCLNLRDDNTALEVGGKPEIESWMKDYSDYCTDEVNKSNNEVIRTLWARASLTMKKLAAISAVGKNCTHPAIEWEDIEWARSLVHKNIEAMTFKFLEGEISLSNNENVQIANVNNTIVSYLSSEYRDVSKFNVPASLFNDQIVPYSYISKHCLRKKCFKNDKIGATRALRRAIENMCDSGDLVELPRGQAIEKYGTRAKCYLIANVDLFKKAKDFLL